jgi:osmoprotectant transport system substrate-binding protein
MAAGNATDGLIPAFDFAVLEDDRHYFPPYEAVAVVRQESLQQHPEIAGAIAALSDKISDQEMQKLNYALDGLHRDATDVAHEFLKNKGLIQ